MDSIYCNNDQCSMYQVAVDAADLIVPVEVVSCGGCAELSLVHGTPDPHPEG